MNLQDPPQELLVEMAKEICTGRMRSHPPLGKIIASSEDWSATRLTVDKLWLGTDDTAERQRSMYLQDAKIAIETIVKYLERM